MSLREPWRTAGAGTSVMTPQSGAYVHGRQAYCGLDHGHAGMLAGDPPIFAHRAPSDHRRSDEKRGPPHGGLASNRIRFDVSWRATSGWGR